MLAGIASQGLPRVVGVAVHQGGALRKTLVDGTFDAGTTADAVLHFGGVFAVAKLKPEHVRSSVWLFPKVLTVRETTKQIPKTRKGRHLNKSEFRWKQQNRKRLVRLTVSLIFGNLDTLNDTIIFLVGVNAV